MIVSQNGTSYDTSNGSQQPDALSVEPVQRSDREQINRWEDDGPGPHAHTVPPAADSQRKPAWSVLSLTHLLQAIRQLREEPADAAIRGRNSLRGGTPAAWRAEAAQSHVERLPYVRARDPRSNRNRSDGR